MVPVRLHNFGKTVGADALIDTGATFSIFKAEIADFLGVPIERGKKVLIITIGDHLVGYRHNLQMQVLDKTFDCEVVFSRDFRFSLNLLGRNGFLDNHLVTFNQADKKIIVEEVP